MSLSSLIERALELEEIDVNLYRSSAAQLWKPFRARGVFGGQIIGLSLASATRTVPPHFGVHSLHCYFLLAGSDTASITYHVDRIRDGKSFATRRVTAMQRGVPIFMMSCSFQTAETSPLAYQRPMPDVPKPEELLSQSETFKKWLEDPNTPQKFHRFLEMRAAEPVPIEFRPVKQIRPEDFLGAPEKSEPKQMVWMRATGKLPDELSFHQIVAAYTSDHFLLNTSMLVHGISRNTDPYVSMMASLDHSIWFHAPFRADDFLLYEMESTRTANGRAMCFGRVYTRDGVLVMSCAQEGIIRITHRQPKL